MRTQITGGVGNTRNVTYYEQLRIHIENGPAFDTIAGFTDGLEPQGFGLLGHAGFFETFIVTFDGHNKVFHIDT